MAVEVDDGKDRGHVALEDEEHAEGKPVENGAPDVREDQGELQRPAFDTLERRAYLAQESKPEIGLFAFIPSASLLSVEFGFRPNDQCGHLTVVAKSGLHPLDDFPPGAGLAGGSLMGRKPLT